MSRIILFNKPFNVLTQFQDEENRADLSQYIPLSGVYPAGRLDYDSEGLVVLTDDGALQHQISHPRRKLEKIYWVQVEGTPNEKDVEPLREGIVLKDGITRPAGVKIIDAPVVWDRDPPIRQRRNIRTSWLEIRITEGRNRQVRRMTAAIGFPTLRIIRYAVGSWTLDGLPPGQWRVILAAKRGKQGKQHGLEPKSNRRSRR